MKVPQFLSVQEIVDFFQDYVNSKTQSITEKAEAKRRDIYIEMNRDINIMAKEAERMERDCINNFHTQTPIKKIVKVTPCQKYDRVRSWAIRLANAKRGRELKGMGVTEVKNKKVVIFSDEVVYAQCYTCKHWNPIIDMECGHYKSRKYYAYRRSIKNTKPQCTHCNKYKAGNVDQYRKYLITEYGAEYVNGLDTAVLRIQKLPADHELEKLYNDLKPRVVSKLQEYGLSRIRL